MFFCMHTPPLRALQHLPEGLCELWAAEGVDGRVDEGVAHQQHHVELEQRAVTLTVWVRRAHHDDDEVEEKRRPAHYESPKEDGESQGPSHAAAAPPPLVPTLPPATGGQSCDPPGVHSRQHEHVDVEEADGRQGDDEEDDKADHDELGSKEPHHEHS